MVIWTMMSKRGGDEKCYQNLLEDIILMNGQNVENKVFIEKQNQQDTYVHIFIFKRKFIIGIVSHSYGGGKFTICYLQVGEEKPMM